MGDRYLNAKSAKTQVRNDEISKSLTTMKEFVRDPLCDDFADYIQCLWYEIETANAYLRTNQILSAFRLYNYVISHFNVFIEDQVSLDFYFSLTSTISALEDILSMISLSISSTWIESLITTSFFKRYMDCNL